MEPKVTRDEMLRCLNRELKMRNGVYSKRVQRGEMRPQDAQRELAVMTAVRDHIATCQHIEGQMVLELEVVR